MAAVAQMPHDNHALPLMEGAFLGLCLPLSAPASLLRKLVGTRALFACSAPTPFAKNRVWLRVGAYKYLLSERMDD